MSRADEIAQGLREAGGALIGGLVVFDYIQGREDFATGNPPPNVTTASYDIGRARAAEEAEAYIATLARLEQGRRESRERVRAALAEHPEALAEFNATIAELDAASLLQAERA